MILSESRGLSPDNLWTTLMDDFCRGLTDQPGLSLPHGTSGTNKPIVSGDRIECLSHRLPQLAGAGLGDLRQEIDHHRKIRRPQQRLGLIGMMPTRKLGIVILGNRDGAFARTGYKT